jgi:hypothetical protein
MLMAAAGGARLAACGSSNRICCCSTGCSRSSPAWSCAGIKRREVTVLIAVATSKGSEIDRVVSL